MLSHYKFRISIADKYHFMVRISILCRLLLFIAVKCLSKQFLPPSPSNLPNL
nr:MAG TPA: hypothetical protein [Caudoviricetes sp.]